MLAPLFLDGSNCQIVPYQLAQVQCNRHTHLLDNNWLVLDILQQKAINDVAPFFNVSPEQLANEIQFNQAPANY
jgi:hypothetical protein